MEIYFDFFDRFFGIFIIVLFFVIGAFATIRQFKIQALEKKLMQKINWVEMPEPANLSWSEKRGKYKETNKEWNEAIKRFFYEEAINLKYDKKYFNDFMKWRKRSSSNYSRIGIGLKDLLGFGKIMNSGQKLDIQSILKQVSEAVKDSQNIPSEKKEAIITKFQKGAAQLKKPFPVSYSVAIILTISAAFFVFLGIMISRDNPDSPDYIKHLFYWLALVDFLIAVYFYRKGSEENY